MNAALTSASLSMARMAVLHRLAESAAPVGLKDLAEALGCSKSNASVLSDRMVQDGLLHREVDPTDRRGVLLSLTSAGSAAHEEGFAIIRRQEENLFADVSLQDRDALLRTLGQVAQ
ncbi:hypothetical protein GCM10022383_03390 [Microbacterium soli]|uniref:HTH marR-type domain-containing protein n=2 Tax=Microbacterium soli TaxID=446075 RepID=A0ABP7MSM5_9MICO